MLNSGFIVSEHYFKHGRTGLNCHQNEKQNDANVIGAGFMQGCVDVKSYEYSPKPVLYKNLEAKSLQNPELIAQDEEVFP